jgi:hypothetical protein
MSNEIFEIGKSYLVRTVTFTYTGKLINQDKKFLVFRSAAWIPDTGRLHDTLKDGSNIDEVEPYVNDLIVSKGAIVDATIWQHDLPVKQK